VYIYTRERCLADRRAFDSRGAASLGAGEGDPLVAGEARRVHGELGHARLPRLQWQVARVRIAFLVLPKPIFLIISALLLALVRIRTLSPR